MSSVIAPMPKAKCKACGSTKFISKVYDERLKISVYVCQLCGNYPDQIKLRRSLPIGLNGESERVDILFNRLGKRIEDIHEALHIARAIDYDLRDGRFNPDDYRSKNMNSSFLFKNIIKEKYIPHCINKFGVGGFETKQVMVNHLVNFFGETDIRKIKSGTIREFQLSYKCGVRSKDLSIQELKHILDYFLQIEIIKIMPGFPKTDQSRERSIKEFITKEDQNKIISYIKDEYYHDMIELLAIYTLRPGDLRALKWKGLDFKNNTITISEHFAKAKIKSGRKSTDKELILPMTERFIEIISKLPHSLNGEEFVFKAKDSQGRFTKGAVGEARMRIHWNKANLIAHKKDGVKIVSLYIGTKSSSLTEYINTEGNTPEEVMALTGHSSVKMLKRYAKESDENKLRKVKKILNKPGKKEKAN